MLCGLREVICGEAEEGGYGLSDPRPKRDTMSIEEATVSNMWEIAAIVEGIIKNLHTKLIRSLNVRLTSFTILTLLTSCMSWQSEYLEAVSGKATQDEVARKMRPPESERNLSNRDTVWIYRSMKVVEGTSKCTQYVLIFDSQKLLGSWTSAKC